MSDYLEKIKFIKSYSEAAGVSLVLFSDWRDYETWTQGAFNLSNIPNVVCRSATSLTDLLGVKAERCFLWHNAESFHVVIQKDIKLRLGASLIYDLDAEEYILDFAAEKV